jgi:hypothetical protein
LSSGNLDEVKRKVVGDEQCLVGALGKGLQSTSPPLFAKAFFTHDPIFLLLGEVFPYTPEGVKRRAAGQEKGSCLETLVR